LILLDTNVVSELWRPQPSRTVRSWLDAQDEASLFICTPVLAELHFGADRLPPGRRKEFLNALINQVEVEGFKDRILSFDVAAASVFGRVGARREQSGKRMEPVDAMIAAIALTHGLMLATRDTNDFADLDLDLINPFELPIER
jgi:predicted nucleic acid-binding protein